MCVYHLHKIQNLAASSTDLTDTLAVVRRIFTDLHRYTPTYDSKYINMYLPPGRDQVDDMRSYMYSMFAV
jgi:hypothetical protein